MPRSRKEQINVLRAYWSIISYTAVGGSASTSIPAATFEASSVTQTSGGDTTTTPLPTRGIITTGGGGLVKLRNANDFRPFSSGGSQVFARLTFAAGNYIITYANIIAGVETPINFPGVGNFDVQALFPEVMEFEEVPSDAFVLDGASFAFSTDTGSGGSIIVQDNGSPVELNTTTLNFIGGDVSPVAVGGGVVNVFIPPPPFLSHWNTSDGSNGAQFVTESISRTTARISTPVGGVFNTNGWEGTNQPASINGTAAFTTPGNTTGFGGDSTMTVTFYDADGTTVLDSLTTTPIIANAVFNSASGRITITITNFGLDSGIRFRANANVSVNVAGVFTDNALDGGRYHIEVDHTVDTNTDGTGTYSYVQADVFYDTDPATPSINAGVTIAESTPLTKHLSGLEYYILNSAFQIDVNDIDDHNTNTQRIPTSLDVIGSEYGIPLQQQSPFGAGAGNFSGWNNDFNTNNINYSNAALAITQVDYRLISDTANVSSFVEDPWNVSATIDSSNASVLIDTFLDNATDLFEDFNGEDRRETSTFGGIGSWVSTNSLLAGEAMVFNGLLISPEVATLVRLDGPATVTTDWSTFSPTVGGPNPNYTGLVVPVNYFRRFPDVSGSSISSFTFTFTGTFVVDATTDLINSDLEIFLYKIDGIGNVGPPPGNTTPLELHGPAYNFATFDDGVTDGHVRESSSSGNNVNGTFGGFPMEDGLFCHIRINNNSIQIDSITVAYI